jgi:hypothetical protein
MGGEQQLLPRAMTHMQAGDGWRAVNFRQRL